MLVPYTIETGTKLVPNHDRIFSLKIFFFKDILKNAQFSFKKIRQYLISVQSS